jgi:MA3 domain
VLMHCCQQEKHFNKFYAQVASYLCSQYNEFKFSLQVGFYQKLKVCFSQVQLHFLTILQNLTENELPARGVQNISQLLAHVVGDLALSILTLKVI